MELELKLKDKVCFITGAGRGLGKAMAEEFAMQGATVFINDINADDAEQTCELIKSRGFECYLCPADVGIYDEVKNMTDFVVRKASKLDILVNNAAILRDKAIHNMDIQFHWEEVIRINLTGVFYCSREAVIRMRETGYGRIINMTSVIGLCGNFGQTAYGAAKAGVIGFTKSLALETAAKGITVNAIAPGFIETDMIKDMPPDVLEKMKAKIPMRKLGKPQDIAKLALFLASDDANYITGQVYGVNGGFLMP